MPHQLDGLTAMTPPVAGKISLVEAACARFESQRATGSAQAAATADSPTIAPFKRRAHERLKLLQNTGVAHLPESLRANAAAEQRPPVPARGGWWARARLLRVHLAWASVCAALVAGLLVQLGKNTAPDTSTRTTVIQASTVTSPNVHPLQLQMDRALTAKPLPQR
jgi:hypothetical protein